MNKSTVIIIIFVLVVGAGIGVYFFTRENETPNEDIAAPASHANAVINSNTADVNTSATSRYIGEEFTLEQPAGWIAGHLTGTLVSLHAASESYPPESAAGKINFQSYIAVSFDAAEDKTLTDVYQISIDGITSVISDVNIFDVDEETVNGLPAKFAAMEFTRQEVNYTILFAVYLAGDKYYAISFNTTTERWPEYRDMAYTVARSFKLKNE
jgi:hypothetical protein